MGLILDSSVLIAAERQGRNARQVLTVLREHIGETEVGISVVTLIELAHGAARADTPQRRSGRQKFIEELISAMPVYPVTVAIALRAGQIDGENQARGLRLALPDLLIGVTALELGYDVGTANVRHFEDVPGLSRPASLTMSHLTLIEETGDWDWTDRVCFLRRGEKEKV
jgi:predicted nucleic acid-binding protein